MMSQGPLQAVRYQRGRLEVLDQLRLPHDFHYDEIWTAEDAFECIKSMRVRGAPAIAIVAALGLAIELTGETLLGHPATVKDTLSHISARLDYLQTSRPTAVDLGNAVKNLKAACRSAAAAANSNSQSIVGAYVDAAEAIFQKDLETNKAIGAHGTSWLQTQLQQSRPSSTAARKMSVLTHCNTGSLATSGYGTALGIVRSLQEQGRLARAFCTETRPYNQGSRLTAFELVHEGIPATLVTDSMAGALLGGQRRQASGEVDDEEKVFAVIVGADRVVRNGDTANKIGTYALAVLARHHGVKFVVAAPTTSIDLETASGADIRIEQRVREELTQVSGPVVNVDGSVDVSRPVRVATADQRIDAWNPAFDVTPYELIDCVVTEIGPVVKGDDGMFDFSTVMPERWAEVQSEGA